MAQPTPDGTVLPSPLAVVGSQYCEPYPVDLSIVRKLMIFSAGNFDVVDTNGNLVFKVRKKNLTWLHQNKILLDPAGNPILTLRRKVMILRSKWQVFKGQSIDKKDLIFTVKKHSVFYLRQKLDVFLANNTTTEVCDFQVKRGYAGRSCTVYARDNNAIVAQMHKKFSVQSFFLGKDNFMDPPPVQVPALQVPPQRSRPLLGGQSGPRNNSRLTKLGLKTCLN